MYKRKMSAICRFTGCLAVMGHDKRVIEDQCQPAFNVNQLKKSWGLMY